MSVVSGPRLDNSGLFLAVDFANKRCYSSNVHPSPLDGFSWATTGAIRSTLERDASTRSPVGTTPIKMIPTSDTSGGYTATYNNSSFNLAEAVQGEIWTFSFWAKANKNIQASSFIFEADATGAYIAAPSKSYNLTTEWQRFEQTYTFVNPLSAYVQVRVDVRPDTSAIYWFDGFQVEKSSNATEFNSNYFSGTDVYDLSFSKNTGFINSVPVYELNSYSSQRDNLGIQFDNVPDTHSLSLELVLRPLEVASSTTQDRIISRDLSDYWALALDLDRNFYFRISPADGAATTSSGGASLTTLGEWHHIVARYDGLTGNRGIWINGVSGPSGVGATSLTDVIGTGSSRPIGIGSNVESVVQYNFGFVGLISQAKVYNTYFSESKIVQHYKASRSRYGF